MKKLIALWLLGFMLAACDRPIQNDITLSCGWPPVLENEELDVDTPIPGNQVVTLRVFAKHALIMRDGHPSIRVQLQDVEEYRNRAFVTYRSFSEALGQYIGFKMHVDYKTNTVGQFGLVGNRERHSFHCNETLITKFRSEFTENERCINEIRRITHCEDCGGRNNQAISVFHPSICATDRYWLTNEEAVAISPGWDSSVRTDLAHILPEDTDACEVLEKLEDFTWWALSDRFREESEACMNQIQECTNRTSVRTARAWRAGNWDDCVCEVAPDSIRCRESREEAAQGEQ